MFLYKKLTFNNVEQITQKLLFLARENNPDCRQSKTIDIGLIKQRIPELIEQFESIGCYTNICREIISPPFQGTKIHRDGIGENLKQFSINWPLENCENTYMCWWEFNGEMELDSAIDDPAGIKNYDVLLYKETNGRIIGQCEIVEPTLTNIKIFHSVINAGKTRRILSFRFNPEPYHLIADER